MRTKNELELRAKLTLGHVIGMDIRTMECLDKPDLQDIPNSIAIEVVEDCYWMEKRHEAFIEEIWEESYACIPSQKIERFDAEQGELIVRDDHLVAATLDMPKSDNPMHLIETIQSKIGKLESGNYHGFNTYDLYVFVDTVTLYQSHIEQVMDAITQDGKCAYTHIYLDGWHKFVVCDMRNRVTTCYEISNGDRNDISRQVDEWIRRENDGR